MGEIFAQVAKAPNVIALRMGGDEFAVGISVGEDEDSEPFFTELCEKLNRYIDVGTQRLHLSTSLGVASFPTDGADLESLIRNADHAVYVAKAKNGGQMVRFSKDMLGRLRAVKDIERRLEKALQNRQLFLVWQPQFELATGCITGAEALLRWQDQQTGKFISPAEFVPIAERSDLILALDRYVIEAVCRSADGFFELHPNLMISLNLSGKSFQDPGLPEYVRRTLQETGVPPEKLEIEITESVFIDQKRTAEAVFSELIDMGVRFALDDFGTGFSNMAHLGELHLNRIKIDRSFVDGMEENQKKQKLVRSILALAGSLNIEAVAEGVENDAQMQFLINNACQYAQGFYLSKPLEGEKFRAFLKWRSTAKTGRSPAAKDDRPSQMKNAS